TSMASHTEYSVTMNSAYATTTRTSGLLPASERKVRRRRDGESPSTAPPEPAGSEPPPDACVMHVAPTAPLRRHERICTGRTRYERTADTFSCDPMTCHVETEHWLGQAVRTACELGYR